MADEKKTRKIDPDDRAKRQEIADAMGTTPDDPAVTKWIHDHNSDIRVLLGDGGAEGVDSPPTAEPAVPTKAPVTSEDPFTGETYTIAEVEPGRLSTDEEQQIRNLQERIELAERGITPESFLDPNGIATPAREVQIGDTHVTTHEVVYPDRRVVTITDRVDADGDGTRTERLKDFSTEIDGVRETPLEAGLPAGPAVVVSGTQYGTPNFGPAEDTRPTTPEELVDNTDLLDAIRPGGPTTDAGKALLDQFPGAGNTPMSSNAGGSNQPGSGTNTPSPATSSNPSSGDSGDMPGGYSPEFPSSGSASSDDSDFDADAPGTAEPAAGADEGPGVARVTGSYSDSTGTGVSWVDTDGNWWTTTTRPGGTPTTSYDGNNASGPVPPGTPAPTTPPPPPPPAATPPPAEEEEDEEDEEEEEGMVNPDADTGGSGIDTGTGDGTLQPDYGSSTGAGVTDGGRGDLGIDVIMGEIRVPNTAGPDVNPDADTGGSGVDTGTGDGTLQPDYGSSTGAGVTDFGRGDLSTGLGPIGGPIDDGINPYAHEGAESFDARGAGFSELDAQISGFDDLGAAALDIGLGSLDLAGSEQEPNPDLDGPVDDMFG